MIEPDSALSQSSKSDENIAVVTKSQEKGRKEDDAKDEIATVTGRENDTDNDVAKEAQTVKANNEDPSLITRKPEPETRPISQQQLVAEVKGIYAGLVMVEAKCIRSGCEADVSGHFPRNHDVSREDSLQNDRAASVRQNGAREIDSHLAPQDSEGPGRRR